MSAELSEKTVLVVTTVNAPNRALRTLADGAARVGWDFLLVGDQSTPPDFRLGGARFLGLAAQRELPWKSAVLAPLRHYARKNLGYLVAASEGAEWIVETDDDNIPYDSFFQPRVDSVRGERVEGRGWENVYRRFSSRRVWPRGFPLDEIRKTTEGRTTGFLETMSECPIRQGLADGDPDVDAIFRFTGDLPVHFEKREPVALGAGLWCPFNSQNTSWQAKAFRLLYLPATCSFRMTDIVRGFVAQRVGWTCGWRIVFHEATVFQERNSHDLLRDFRDELDGILLNKTAAAALDRLPLEVGEEAIPENMLRCYEALSRLKLVGADELRLLRAWLEDFQSVAAIPTHVR